MTLDTLPQGDLRLLDHPVAQNLLSSAIPARVGYLGTDGSPRVSPMWFHWAGSEIVFGADTLSLKVRALQADQRVAISIDSESAPYQMLSIRGLAGVTVVSGVVPEYITAALRYLGPEAGQRFAEHMTATKSDMARIAVRPDWVGVIDFQTRFPSTYRS